LPPAWLVLAGLDHRKFGRGFVFKSENFSLLMKPATRRDGASIGPCLVAIAGQWRQGEGNPALPWSGPRAVGNPGCRGGVQADCRQVGLLPGSLMLLHLRQFSGFSFSRSMKTATKKRRRQLRAAPGRRSRASGPGRRRDSARTADRGCRDWSRYRLAGVRQVAAGVARAGDARTSAVLPGLRSLDRESRT
jgi:hypothetical protein